MALTLPHDAIDACPELYLNTGVVPFSVIVPYVAVLPPDRCTIWHADGIRLRRGWEFGVFGSSRAGRCLFSYIVRLRGFLGAEVPSFAYGRVRNIKIQLSVRRIYRFANPYVGMNCGYRRAPGERLLADLELRTHRGTPI